MYNYLLILVFILSNFSSFAQSPTLEIKDPYSTTKRIFDNYNEFQESTDSPSNLDSLKQSLKLLETTQVSQKDLTLVINVWMYYTVTDFSTTEYTWNVLKAHKTKSIRAVKNRIQNKLDWESEHSAPYTDLDGLLNKLLEL